jgi:hypothetical protein
MLFYRTQLCKRATSSLFRRDDSCARHPRGRNHSRFRPWTAKGTLLQRDARAGRGTAAFFGNILSTATLSITDGRTGNQSMAFAASQWPARPASRFTDGSRGSWFCRPWIIAVSAPSKPRSMGPNFTPPVRPVLTGDQWEGLAPAAKAGDTVSGSGLPLVSGRNGATTTPRMKNRPTSVAAGP